MIRYKRAFSSILEHSRAFSSILASRHVNDSMVCYVAKEVIKLMTRRQMQVVGSRIVVLGLTFKES